MLVKSLTAAAGSNGNITYQVVPSSSNGSSYLNATVQSLPQGVNNTGSWNVTYTDGTEPYPGAHLILGNPTKNGTNLTMAWPGQPAGGLLICKPTHQVESNFDFQSLNL